MNHIGRVGGAWAPRILIAGLVLAFVTAMFPAPASAGHSWGTYHWGRETDSTVVAIPIIDSMTPDWDRYLGIARDDWTTRSFDIDLWTDSYDDSKGTRKRCAAVSGKVRVCNAEYGHTGWLGVASIWVSSGHIVQGTAKQNDTYFNSEPYSDPNKGWKQFVVCQEVGHTFGLGHVNETFDDANTGSCMDYTSNPLGPPSNLYTNDHDREQLDDVIYVHGDGNNTFATSAAQTAGLSGVEIPDPVGAEQGGVSVFVTDLGGGNQIIQFVIWADANLMAATHANENAPVAGTTTDSEGIPADGGTHDHEETASTTVVTTDAVNLRAAPSRQAAVLAELAAGTALTVTGPAEWGQGIEWIPVATPDGALAGYVAAEFLAAG